MLEASELLPDAEVVAGLGADRRGLDELRAALDRAAAALPPRGRDRGRRGCTSIACSRSAAPARS